MVDTEEEGTGTDDDNSSTVVRSNRMMAMEISNLASRSVQLQMSLEEYQQGLGESTTLLEQAKRREAELMVKHCLELKQAGRDAGPGDHPGHDGVQADCQVRN